ncbi:MAG: ParB/Srx family N-terminal domain-containing protein [Pontimonas sp.]
MTTMVVAPEFIDQTPIDELVPYDNNPRTHSAVQIERLVNSLKEFGFTNPILVDDDCNVIAGHGRLEAAKIVGLKTVPTITLSHLSEDQRRAYVIADNQLALNSGWDDDLLQSELQALGDAGFDLSLLGWGDDIPSFAEEPDYSALDDLDDPTNDLAEGVMKAIQIEFRSEDYEEAKALVDAARKRGDYVGMKLIEALSV